MTTRKYIATKLHRALEMAPDEPALRAMTDAPHYVIDRRLIEMFGRDDVTKSISALIEAEIARLPFPHLVVEFEAEDRVRRFAHISEQAGGFACTMATLNDPALTITREPVEVGITRLPVVGFYVRNGQSSDLDRLAAVFAVAVAMLMLNTQGIEKELIEARALNTSRVASGKPAVPRHTLLRIGTVIDAHGNEVSFSNSRHMPLHLRAGHVRHQAFGKGRTERKLVYIPPTLVNFKPIDVDRPVPQPKRVVSA